MRRKEYQIGRQKYWIGRDIIMLEANTEAAPKNEYGKIVRIYPDADWPNKYGELKIRWENGNVNTVPAHWVGVFTCDD